MSVTIHNGSGCSFLSNKPIEPKRYNKQVKTRQTMFFNKPIYIVAKSAIVGSKEGEGPLGKYFESVKDDIKLGEKCFECAEVRMLDEAIRNALSEAQLTSKEIDVLISGDLLNQLTTTNYVARNFDIPLLGVYSACSTMSEALSLGSALIDSGHYDTIACSTCSHFATAERQFRYPLEYGCQRPPYAQWTVTAAGCMILSSKGSGLRIESATLGKVIDFGTNDLSNMGAAMAPAAMDTMCAMFRETGTQPEDYDLIVTGDLGKLGSDILRELMGEQGYFLGQNYKDCGNLIYSVEQNCYQGGSGCGCSASVMNAFILKKMEEGEYKKVAYLATGALMSTQSCYQGETIPCISHAVVIVKE